MPAVAPLPPDAIRELLEAKGYECVAEDEYNWAFAIGDEDEPIMIPRTVELVPLEIAFHVARKVGFGEYFDKLSTTDAAAEADPPIH